MLIIEYVKSSDTSAGIDSTREMDLNVSPGINVVITSDAKRAQFLS